MQQGLNRRFMQHAESRDAIVWDIDAPNKLVRCKVQGSDEYILCHYPRNSNTLPSWCRRGNAVRIAHKGGVRGFLEVVGNGRAIPSPVSGGTLPDPNNRPDEVVSGGGVTPYSGMTLKVEATTYRILNVTYALTIDGIPMADPPYITMGDATVMGADGAYLIFDAAPAAPNARYDLIVAGADGLAHVVKGTASASPVMPKSCARKRSRCGAMSRIRADSALWPSASGAARAAASRCAAGAAAVRSKDMKAASTRSRPSRS